MANCEDIIIIIYRKSDVNTAVTPRQVLNRLDCCSHGGEWCFLWAPTCDSVVDPAWTDNPLSCCLSSHGLSDVFQALLNVVNNLHCSLWDPGSWAEDGTHAALVQELIILHTHRGGTRFIWSAVNEKSCSYHAQGLHSPSVMFIMLQQIHLEAEM